MKIVTISWIRNEADMLEAFVRHHCTFVDQMIIVDHRSQDNSRSILQSLRAEGLPIDVRHDERFEHAQAEVMTGLLREAAQLDPDWVLPLDGDELVRAGSGSVPDALSEGPQDRVLLLPWRGYVPTDRDDPAEKNPVRRITHRRSAEHPPWYKVAVPRSVLRRPELALSYGNHGVWEGPDKKGVDAVISHTLSIAHFPVRTPRQLMKKIYGSWLSYRVDPIAIAGASFQWKEIFERMKRGESLDEDDMTKIAADYASTNQWKRLPEEFTGGSITKFGVPDEPPRDVDLINDPVPCDIALKYPASDIDPLSVLLESAEALAVEHAKARKNVTPPEAA